MAIARILLFGLPSLAFRMLDIIGTSVRVPRFFFPKASLFLCMQVCMYRWFGVIRPKGIVE